MKRIRFWLILVFLLVIISIVTMGCWDRREIEDLGIVMGIAIDSPKSTRGEEQERKESADYGDRKEHRLTMTYQFVIPKNIGGQAGTPSTGKNPYSNTSSEGDTIFQISRQFSALKARTPFYRHLKVIIISDKVASSVNMNKLLDGFIRDPEIGRDVEMMIAKGSARKVLEMEPEKEDIPASSLVEMGKNFSSSSRMAPPLTLGNMSKKMASGASFIMQRIVTCKKGIKLAGAAVIKGKTNTLLGWLGEEETDGINWLSGELKGGIVEAVDDKTKETIVYEINNVKSKIKPKVNGEEISFTVDIESEGRLAEDWTVQVDAFEEAFIQRVVQEVEEEVRSVTQQALEKTQKEFKVDVVGFGKQLSIHYPDVWEKVKDNWDEEFSKASVEIKPKINIRRFGRRGTKM